MLPFPPHDPGSRRAEAWRQIQLIILAGVALSALVRVGFAFEVDALIIATLSGLLFWVQFAEWRRTRRLGEKVDQLLARTRYGPLTTEDLEAIRALRAEAERLSSSARQG